MGLAQPSIKQNFADYLAWEAEQPERHEYVAGEIFAMSGARRVHVTVSLNLASAFKAHLRGGPCRVYIADLKLRVEAADAVFYPDVMVTCDRRDHAAELYVSHPILILEVLSESTAAYDRGAKFADCRKLESLQEYVIVDIEARSVECFRRDAENHWVLHDFAGQPECHFASIDLAVPLSTVFEDVELADDDSEADQAATA